MEKKVGVKQPVGQKLRREREDADNTLRQNRQKAEKSLRAMPGKRRPSESSFRQKQRNLRKSCILWIRRARKPPVLRRIRQVQQGQ